MAAGTEFAIDKIKNAFTSLLGKQPFSKIKTVDIIRVSGVSHQTFYRLFLDKYNLAETAVFELLWSFQAIYGPNATWKDTSYSLLAIILNNKEYFKNLVTDLAGKVVGVQAASAALDVLQSDEEGGKKELSDTFSSLNEFADYNTAFTELQAGALDALAIDIGVAKYQLNSRGEGFKMLDETLNTEEYAIGFKKGNQALCDIVNADLQKLANDGKVAELAEKYEIADMVSLKAE